MIGTDHEQVLAYKLQLVSALPSPSSKSVEKDAKDSGDAPVSHPRHMSMESDDSVIGLPIENIATAGTPSTTTTTTTTADVASIASSPSPTPLAANEPIGQPSSTCRAWRRLLQPAWHLDAFGAIYSLLWRDVNLDGVHELLVASATGVYVLEADVSAVLQRLDQVLAALPA